MKSDFQFIFPMSQLPWWLLLAGVCIAALVVALRWLERRRMQRVESFASSLLATRLLACYDVKVRRPLFWLPVAGCMLLALALAQPHWGRSWREVTRSSRDILVLLDTSESMNATRPLPNRLHRARQKIEAIMTHCSGDRFGLVAFSGDAEVQCPLTLDHGYFRTILKVVNTDILSREGTDIARALEEAASVFKENEERRDEIERASHIVLLLSDGETVDEGALEQARRLSASAGVYVMGIGDAQGALTPFPAWMRMHMSSLPQQMEHFSHLDEEGLSALALAGGGMYVRSRADNSDVERLCEALDGVQGQVVSESLRLRLVNRYRWPLFFALLCFWAEGAWRVLMPWLRWYRMRKAGRTAV